MPRKWFKNWFNSPYYHILYHQRNDEEAESFITNLCKYLALKADNRILDIACGRGRHAVYLNKLGFDVTGIDLSLSNIKYASDFENERLRFYVHDMRYLFYINYFDVAFNLFTSFGYFETDKEHVNALKTFRKTLKPDGLLVLDFMNVKRILKELVLEEVKTLKNIDFHITRRVENNKIIKNINFHHQDKDHSYKELVTAYTLEDFKVLFEKSGFEIKALFGDYQLNDFDADNSDRLIFICGKKHA